MSNLNPDTREKICIMLNTRIQGKDFRTLGSSMELTVEDMEELELKDNPTEALLQAWELGLESTVDKLNGFLLEMGLVVIDMLNKP